MIAELEQAGTEAKKDLASRFGALRRDPRFIDALAGHLPPDEASQQRLPGLTGKVDAIANLQGADFN